MGISTLIAIPSSVLLGSVYALRNSAAPAMLIPLLQSSLVLLTAAVASTVSVNNVALFGKTPEGSLPWWSHLLFYPYLYPLRVYVMLRRMSNKEPVYTEVTQGLYVGGWPAAPKDIPPGSPAVIDCTCELPKPSFADGLPYLCIRTWDTRGPTPEDIQLAVRWAVRKREQSRPIYIHCAFGHGRSVTVMCALLATLGLADTWKDAEKLIQSVRPRARLNWIQRESLQKWSKYRIVKRRPIKEIFRLSNKRM